MATTTTKRRKPAGPPREAAAAKPVATIAAAAAAIGVHQRTLKEWLSRGAPGSAGKYDVQAIEAWREATLRPTPEAGDDWQKRRTAAQAQREEIRLSRDRRALIEVAEAERIVKRHAAEVRAHLDQLPDFAASLVKLTAAKKKQFVAALGAKVRELCAAFERAERELAEACEGE